MLSSLTHSNRLDDRDYIIFYAPGGQTGETVFLFEEPPANVYSTSTNVNQTISGSNLTLEYLLEGSSFVTILLGGKSLVVLILDKETALQWHAPDLTNAVAFGNYFSIGTNSR